MRLLISVLTILFAVPSVAHATKIASEPVDVIYKNADIVAIVTIVAGSRVDPNDPDCGWKYEGQIEKPYKGGVSATITFGRYSGLELGGRYLVFLTQPSDEYVSLASTNSRSQDAERTQYEKCHAKWQIHMTMQGLWGAIRMSEYSWDKWVEMPTAFISLPESANVILRPHTPEFRPVAHSDPIWILEDDLDAYLRSLSNETPNQPMEQTR